ncbi:AAA family ATPase [Kutzneria sp. NPDC052558]|uniref:AAA family ATPase n=1 Tax=Kutzneria sp. NPDC052558 TaxID=3364121 RepID=UPI0037C755BE
MSRQLVRSLRVEGFLSIREAEVELHPLNVLVGANGAGKSNFIRAIELMGRIGRWDLGLYVGRAGGASKLLHDGSRRMLLEMDAVDIGYTAVLELTSEDSLIFSSEDVRGIGTLAAGHPESRMRPQVADYRPVFGHLNSFRAYHFHDTSSDAPVKLFTDVADNIVLHDDGSNLAAILLRLRDADEPAYGRIVGAIRLVAPFFDDFVLDPEGNEDRIRLRWQQVGSDSVFSANQMSDGTVRFVCLATLLLQPNRPGLVVLDEPELGLHPFAVIQLADLLRQAAIASQIVIATQSVTLMNQFDLDDLIVVERRRGTSVFSRPDPEGLRGWLEDYSLGELWEKNLLGGRPKREDV